jgi:hypothetical protein
LFFVFATVNIFYSATPFCLLFAFLGSTGCNSERVTGSPSSLRRQEVVRLRAANPTKAPVLFGRVQVVDEARKVPMPTSLVAVDGHAYYANENGDYRIAVAPGTHHLLVEHDGVRSVRTTVKVERGDSVQVNFYLRFAD